MKRKSMQQEMYDHLIRYEPEPVSNAMKQSLWLDVSGAAFVAKRRQRNRDAVWGGTLAAVVTFALSGLAWYTPTKTVIVEEIVVSDAPNWGCNDALNGVGALLDSMSKITAKSGQRDAAEEEAHDALSAMDWAALQDAATRTFAINTEMNDLVAQAQAIDLSTPVDVCRG